MPSEDADQIIRDRDYFAWRVSECLRMAQEATEPGAANIHRRMAEQYQVKALAT